MASPVSIGDAILLAKLAYRLGHAVTAGRKHAPAGIREVQNQLYSLGKALDAVGQCASKREQPQDSQSQPTAQEDVAGSGDQNFAALDVMIKNCRGTLEQMENLMSRYDDVKDRPQKNGEKGSWRKDVRTNWKSIRWTIETAEIDTIRGNLNVHITTLNLLLAALNHSQSRNVSGKVDQVHSMMSDVHEWFTLNLKGARHPVLRDEQLSVPIAPDDDLEVVFELSEETQSSSNTILRCPRASFDIGWVDSLTVPTRLRKGIFRCHCAAESHFDRITYRLLPISLIVRLTQQKPEWHVFCASQEIASLRIAGVAPIDLGAFQRNVDLLAASQAMQSVTKAASSSSIYHSATGQGNAASILDTQSQISEFQGRIASVTLASEGSRFTQHSIDAIQILHYRTQIKSAESISLDLFHQHYAEVVITFSATNPLVAASRLVMHLTRLASLAMADESRVVQTTDMFCEFYNNDSPKDCKWCDRIEIVCVTPHVARKLLSSLNLVKQQLQLQYLESPRLGEWIVGRRLCGDAMIQHLYLCEPQATIVFDPRTQLHRLILRSSSLATTITMELPDAVLKRIQDSTTTSVDVSPLAYFVEHTHDGVRIESQITRFPKELLEAPNEELERLSLHRA